MLSLSVLFVRPVAAADVTAALREADLGRIEGDPRLDDRGGFSLAVTVDGCALEVRASSARIPVELLGDAAHHARSEAAEAAARDHLAHARIVEAGPASPGLPCLLAMSRVARELLALPGALALFVEAGAALTESARALPRLTALATALRPRSPPRLQAPAPPPPAPPLELWIAVRRFHVADAAGSFLDTVGMAQLGLPDLEAYAADGPFGEAAASWLRNLSLYLAQQGAPIRTGDTLDGPDGQSWVAAEDSATAPPARQVLRFSPSQ